MIHWSILTGLLVAVSGAESDDPKPDVLSNLHLAGLIPYVQVSSQWATMYSATPMLVAMPVAVEAAMDADEEPLPLLEPTGFGFDEEEAMLNDRPWNWGLAEIGPGVLFPQPPGGGGPRGGAPGSPASGRQGQPMAAAGDTIIINPPADTPDTPQVPEPMSAAVWLAVLGMTAVWLPRKRLATQSTE